MLPDATMPQTPAQGITLEASECSRRSTVQPNRMLITIAASADAFFAH